MPGKDRDTHTGGTHLQIGDFQYLAALETKLALLACFSRIVIGEIADHGDHIVGDWAGKCDGAWHLDRGSVHQLGGQARGGPQADAEVVDADTSATGDSLHGAGCHPPQPGNIVQRLQYWHDGHRAAIRVGDDAPAGLRQGRRVDLGNHQWDVLVHAECWRVVDDDCPGSRKARRQGAGDGGPSGKEHQIQATRIGVCRGLDRHVMAAP